MEFRKGNFSSPMISSMGAMHSGRCLLPALLLAALIAGGCNRAKVTNRAPVSVFKVNAVGAAKDADGTLVSGEYKTLGEVRRRWRIGVFFPHLKDDYWYAVDYGIVLQSKALNQEMSLFHAGGYENLPVQIEQIRQRVKSRDIDGIILGAISRDGLNPLLKEIRASGIPVVDLVNGVSSPDIDAKSLVSFEEMGATAGLQLARLHPAGSAAVKVAWFPGPRDAGWVVDGDRGFRKALDGSACHIIHHAYGDTGARAQRELLDAMLKGRELPDYIVGTAVTAEAAVPFLREHGLEGKIKILAYYMTPGVYRGVGRGTILSAPTDSPVIQGRIAVDQLLRLLEEQPLQRQVGPVIRTLDGENIRSFDRSAALAPEGFVPVLTLNKSER
jgi:protein TorT